MKKIQNKELNQLIPSKKDFTENLIINKNIMSDIEENKKYKKNIFSEIKENKEELSKRKRKSEILKNENLQMKKNKRTIYNFLINSSNSEININSSKDESNNNSIDHVKMENLYLEDGSITTNLKHVYIKKKTLNDIKNFEKLKNLKIELQKKIIENENEKIDFDNSKEIEYNLLSSISSSNRNKFENESELNEKIKIEKEKEIKEEIINELKPKIFEEIYKNEYNKILQEINFDIEEELKNNLDKDLENEINLVKNNFEIIEKNKKEEIEKELKEKCKNEMNEEINKVIETKEKEIQLNNEENIEKYKNKIEKDLIEEYEKKKKDLQEEINKLKEKIFETHNIENLKLKKINSLKKNIDKYNEENLNKLDIIEQIKLIDKKKLEDSEINNNADDECSSSNPKRKKSFPKKYAEDNFDINIELISTNIKTNTPKINRSVISTPNKHKIIFSDPLLYNNIINDKNENCIFKNNIEKYKTRNGKIENKNNNLIDNSINLLELNQKIKNRGSSKSSNKTFNFISPKISGNTSSYGYFNNNHISNNTSFYSQKVDLIKNIIPISPIYSYKHIGAFSNKKINYDIKTNCKNNDINKFNESKNDLNVLEKNENINKYKTDINNNKKNSKIKTIFYSIQINKNIPITISEFGKYLINHIEKEEKYKIIYYNELKKFKLQIQRIFKKSKRTDHFLTEYLFDLWDKINTSFYIRFQILKKITKFSVEKLYEFLDIETEYLSNYYQISEKIFRDIDKRENLKNKLQTKANRNELSVNDKENFDELTKNLEISIYNFQKKYKKLDIIWKGLRYNWFMNYENWFYNMEKKQNINSQNI